MVNVVTLVVNVLIGVLMFSVTTPFQITFVMLNLILLYIQDLIATNDKCHHAENTYVDWHYAECHCVKQNGTLSFICFENKL